MEWTVDVVSDVICPWCYIGKRRLEKAVAGLGPGKPVRVRWHAFRLNPDMPPGGLDRREYRTAKFGTWERSQELDARVQAAGAAEGIAFAFDRIERTPNTLDAHRLVCLAGQAGVQDAVVEALFRGYFTEGRDLGDRETLIELAETAGLGRPRVETFLDSREGHDAVAASEAEARQLGVRGVPFFIVNGKAGVSGAQSPESFRAVFDQLTAADHKGGARVTVRVAGEQSK